MQAPTRAADAPPGYYHAVRVRRRRRAVGSADRCASTSPRCRTRASCRRSRTPATRAATAGTAISLQLQASDPNGDTLRYSASGLPPGLTLNTDHRPHQRHADARRAATTSSSRPATASTARQRELRLDRDRRAARPLAFDAVPVPSPVPTATASASYTASASGSDVRYKLELRRRHAGDAPGRRRPRSATPSRSRHLLRHRHGDRRRRNLPQSRSFLQIVHLPLTANAADARRATSRSRRRPAATRGCGWSTRTTTRSACSTPSRAPSWARSRSAPRRARSPSRPNGMVWVTNKQSAHDQRHQPGHARGHAHDRAAARLDAVRHRDVARRRRRPSSRSRPPGSC